MRLAIVGSGYVGLVTGACLAEKGHHVTCVDVDMARVESINRGEPPMFERDLEELLRRNVPRRLRATPDLAAAVAGADLTMIAVGTPFDGRRIDLSSVEQVARDIGIVLRHKSEYHAVIVKSTVVPGTTDTVVRPLLERTSGKVAGIDFGVGMNPEFLREGEAVADFMQPDRLVLGGEDDRVHGVLEELYSVFPDVEVLKTTNATAEMVKYTSNALLATLISFSNEIANLCGKLYDVDVVDVLQGVKLDRRLNPERPDGGRAWPIVLTYLDPGCGFGGSCFPKDVSALVAFGAERGSPMRLLEQVLAVNEDQPTRMIEFLRRHFASMEGLPVAVLGLAFKPGTDDLRGSPAIPIVQELLASGASVHAYDPIAMDAARELLNDEHVAFCDNLAAAVDGVRAVVLVTRWEEFATLPELLAGVSQPPLVVDGRRLLDPDSVPKYEGIGR